jgi:hypothetical protein
VEETLRLLAPSYPICSNYRYNRATFFSGKLRYDFVIDSDSWFAPY